MDKSAQYKFLSDMYDDFFKLITTDAYKEAKEKASQEKDNKENIPKIDTIEVKEEHDEPIEEPAEEVETEEQKQDKLQEFYDRVEEAHLTDESKLVLKKMIDYARKFR